MKYYTKLFLTAVFFMNVGFAADDSDHEHADKKRRTTSNDIAFAIKNNPSVDISRGDFFRTKGKYKQARSFYLLGLKNPELFGVRKAACHFKLAEVYEKQNNLGCALKHYQRAFWMAEGTERNKEIKENYRNHLANCFRLISHSFGTDGDD